MHKKFPLSHFNKKISLINDSDQNCLQPLFYMAIIRPILINSIYSYEQVEAMHLINRKFFCFTIRYDKKISTNWSIKFEDRSFRIIRVINWNEENRFIQIYAEEENV